MIRQPSTPAALRLTLRLGRTYRRHLAGVLACAGALVAGKDLLYAAPHTVVAHRTQVCRHSATLLLNNRARVSLTAVANAACARSTVAVFELHVPVRVHVVRTQPTSGARDRHETVTVYSDNTLNAYGSDAVLNGSSPRTQVTATLQVQAHGRWTSSIGGRTGQHLINEVIASIR